MPSPMLDLPAIAGDTPLKAAKKPVKDRPPRKPAPKPSKAKKAAPPSKPAKKPQSKTKPPKGRRAQSRASRAPQSDLLKRIVTSLDDDKAEDIVTIDLDGRSSLCDAARDRQRAARRAMSRRSPNIWRAG